VRHCLEKRECVTSLGPCFQSGYFAGSFGAAPAFFLAAHLAFIAAANFALPSGVSCPFFFGAADVVGLEPAAEPLEAEAPPFFFAAQCAFTAAAICARFSGVIPPPRFFFEAEEAGPAPAATFDELPAFRPLISAHRFC